MDSIYSEENCLSIDFQLFVLIFNDKATTLFFQFLYSHGKKEREIGKFYIVK